MPHYIIDYPFSLQLIAVGQDIKILIGNLIKSIFLPLSLKSEAAGLTGRSERHSAALLK
jgi:hypothetical protein